MRRFLDADDDWLETLRRKVWPLLHEPLQRFGFGAVGVTRENQYTGRVRVGEDTLETILVDLGFERNVPAYLKHTEDDRWSEGSWALRGSDDEYGLIEGDEQLHVTLYVPRDGGEGRELYAHAELDWQVSPVGHVEEEDFRAAPGILAGLLNDETNLVLEEDD